MSATQLPAGRPGALVLPLGSLDAEGDRVCVVLFGRTRYLDKAGVVVGHAVRMTHGEALAVASTEGTTP